MNENHQKTFIVIPVYNEEKVVADVINGVKKAGYENIIAVDDGSDDDTYSVLRDIKDTNKDIAVLRHKINRGKGAAAKTGIEAAKLLGAEIIVTMDGDGQHEPADIEKLIEPIIKENYDVVLGVRTRERQNMPLRRKIYNFLGNLITWYFYGLWVTDSQSGLRAYSKKAADLIDTKGDRYEYESEVIREIYLHKLKYREVPIKVKYTDYSKQKIHGQGLINGFKTLYKMVIKLIG